MKKKTTKTRSAAKQRRNTDQKLPFLEHFYELKRRLTYVAVSVVAFGTAAYFVQQQIVAFLLRPAHGQNLIYTSPGGGLDFLFRVCIYTGIVCSLPVIVYQFLKYLEPLLGGESVRFALGGSIISAILALAGMAFGYYAGLPSTLHFLFNQFTTSQIHPLIAVQSYMHFIVIYMVGAALLFQVPLLMVFINRIKPLKPSILFKYERWMVLCSFVLAVTMNPTPNVIDQLMLAGPMILMYQVGIVIITLINRSAQRPKKVRQLLERDEALRTERQALASEAQIVWQEAEAVLEQPIQVIRTALHVPITAPMPIPIEVPVMTKIAKAETEAEPVTPQTSRPRQYISGNRGSYPARTIY